MCEHTGTFEFVQLEKPYDQESSVMEFMNADKRARFDQLIADGTVKIKAKYPIRCVTPKDGLVEAFGEVPRVDVFSLDVESLELNVLRSIDLHTVIIDIFFVECSHEQETIDFMAQTGLYHHVSKVGDDLVFFRKDSRFVKSWKAGCELHSEGHEGFYKFVAPDMHWRCDGNDWQES